MIAGWSSTDNGTWRAEGAGRLRKGLARNLPLTVKRQAKLPRPGCPIPTCQNADRALGSLRPNAFPLPSPGPPSSWSLVHACTRTLPIIATPSSKLYHQSSTENPRFVCQLPSSSLLLPLPFVYPPTATIPSTPSSHLWVVSSKSRLRISSHLRLVSPPQPASQQLARRYRIRFTYLAAGTYLALNSLLLHPDRAPLQAPYRLFTALTHTCRHLQISNLDLRYGSQELLCHRRDLYWQICLR